MDVCEGFRVFNNHDLNSTLTLQPFTSVTLISSEAWLKAAELTPTWVWALVDLPETMHANYRENARFLRLIQQVRDFLHLLIKVHKCETEMIKTLAFRLGTRHKGYMNEGNDNSYWAPFAQQLPIAIAKTYMDVVNHDNRIRRIFRVRVHADRSEEEELINSWRQLMNTIVEAMKRGYEGCPSQKTPMRLSITNSIISMASLRSGRSRSASQFLEPNLSPVMGKGIASAISGFYLRWTLILIIQVLCTASTKKCTT
ncbi:unnamed protein product [Haemonchus placei]|uniref:GLOBIN domain-containing protein n=1 Tax=Haemonchus placei TaxID=6290 RepID=A0A0N4WHS4_HAEPC|nr:unnamed protein product [Haemonchus placei]